MLSLSHPWHPSSHPSCLEHLGTHGPGSAVPHLWKGPQQAREVWDIAASRTGENLWESMKIYQNLWKMNDRWWTYACLASVWHVSVLIHLCGNLEGLERRRTSFDWIAQCPIFIFWGITFPLYVSQARHLLRVFLNGRFGSLFSGPRPKMSCVPFGSGDLRENKGRATWPLHDFWVWMFPLRKTPRSKQATVACRFETKQFGGGKMWSFGVDLDECDISSVVIFVSSSIDP